MNLTPSRKAAYRPRDTKLKIPPKGNERSESGMEENRIGNEIVDAAVKVHSALGPGLLESKSKATRVGPRS